MKKILFIAIFIVFICGCTSRKEGTYNIEILVTNDVHAAFFDSLYVPSDNFLKKSSMSKVCSYAGERKKMIGAENVVLIDIGDNLQGDLCMNYANYIDTLPETNGTFPKHLMSRIYEYVGYDAIVLGNHDIETGHRVYDRIKNEIKIPYLAANAIDMNTGKSYFKPYTIINKNGIKIAVLGFTNSFVKKWIDESLYKGIDFVPIYSIADSLVQAVKKREKPDLIVLSAHTGIGIEDKNEGENIALFLTTHVKDIDFVLAAHDHKAYCNKVHNGNDSILLIEAGSRANNISKIDIRLQYKKGELVSKQINGSIVPLSEFPSDPLYTKEFYNDYKKVKKFANKIVGEIPIDLETIDAVFGFSNYINLINTVQIYASNADISIAAPLSIYNVIEKGDITVSDLLNIYPYENYLYKINLTGSQIKNYLEYSYAKWVSTVDAPEKHLLQIKYDKNSGRYIFINPVFNYDAAKGIIYTVDVTKPDGDKINILSMESGEPFSLDKFYTVAISSYRASGAGDILLKGAGVNPDTLHTLEKYKNIRSHIYDYFMNGNKLPLGEKPNWKFIPDNKVLNAMKRDKALITRK